MKKYLNHLIEDMHKAVKNLPAKPYLEISDDDECLRGVMEYESTEPKPMQEWFGIDKLNFPAVEKLTKEELELLVEEILKLWHAYNFDAVLPEYLPANIAYKILVDNFDKPVIWVSEGTIGIEFCNYETENCPFPKEYCMCKNLENEIDNDLENEISSLDNAAEIAILAEELEEIYKNKSKKDIYRSKIEQYVNQLIEDLYNATEKILSKPCIPDNIDIRSAKDMAELIETPFLTIEELTGISQNAFPDHIDMGGIETRKVLKAMLELMDAYRVKIHFPDELPFEMKFEAFREGWDTTYVKHLPYSGDDVDFCTDDPQTCPYGEYCDCGEEIDLSDDEPPDLIIDDDDNFDCPF